MGEQSDSPPAAAPGAELPPLSGPLVAFTLADGPGPEDPVHLGGGLHAVHPGSGEAAQRRRDPSLDAARITLVLDDPAGERLETTANRGVWRLAFSRGQSGSSALFLVNDGDGRLRTWLLLRAAWTMLGRAHLWLPALPPPP